MLTLLAYIHLRTPNTTMTFSSAVLKRYYLRMYLIGKFVLPITVTQESHIFVIATWWWWWWCWCWWSYWWWPKGECGFVVILCCIKLSVDWQMPEIVLMICQCCYPYLIFKPFFDASSLMTIGHTSIASHTAKSNLT